MFEVFSLLSFLTVLNSPPLLAGSRGDGLVVFSKGLRGFFGGFRACGTLEELRDSLEGAFDPWWILKTRFESFGSALEVKDSCAKEPEALRGCLKNPWRAWGLPCTRVFDLRSGSRRSKSGQQDPSKESKALSRESHCSSKGSTRSGTSEGALMTMMRGHKTMMPWTSNTQTSLKISSTNFRVLARNHYSDFFWTWQVRIG